MSAVPASARPPCWPEHDLAACALYRDELLVNLPEADWLDFSRSHYRSRFVQIASRAAQLLIAHGEAEQAEELAQRALAADPWHEGTYAALAGAAIARGDRSRARDTLTRCATALAELGAEPDEATRQLSRRCRLHTLRPARAT